LSEEENKTVSEYTPFCFVYKIATFADKKHDDDDNACIHLLCDSHRCCMWIKKPTMEMERKLQWIFTMHIVLVSIHMFY
jgi:hypothetical protein